MVGFFVVVFDFFLWKLFFEEIGVGEICFIEFKVLVVVFVGVFDDLNIGI